VTRKIAKIICAAVVVLSLQAVLAASKTNIISNKTFCTTNSEACVRGTLTYHDGTRVLQLRGRVRSAAGPGVLRIRLVFKNEDGASNAGDNIELGFT